MVGEAVGEAVTATAATASPAGFIAFISPAAH